MTHRVLISETVAQEGIDYLEEHGYQVKRGHGIDHLSLLEDIQDCDAVLVRVAIIDQEIIEKNPQLKVIMARATIILMSEPRKSKEFELFLRQMPIPYLSLNIPWRFSLPAQKNFLIFLVNMRMEILRYVISIQMMRFMASA